MEKLKKWASIFTAIASILPQILANIPAVEIFNLILPPAYPEEARLISIGSGFLILIAVWFLRIPTIHKKKFPSELKIAIPLFFVSLLFIFLLLISFDLTVIEAHGKRFQVGFNTYDWSLEKVGLERKKISLDLEDWINESGGKPIYWTHSSIVFAGIMNLALYLLAFCFWTASFALLAKMFYKKEAQQNS